MEKTLNISLIKELLYLEVKDYIEKIQKQKNIQADINQLKEIIRLLESENYKEMKDNFILFYALIPTFFLITEEAAQNISNSLYKAICKINNYLNNPERFLKADFERGKKYIKNLTDKLNSTLEELQAELIFIKPNISEEIISEYKTIHQNLKYGKNITSYQYKLLVELFKRKEIDDKTIILLLEKIKAHNIKSHISKDINYEKINAVSNIILSGFEKYEDISWLNDKRKSQLDELINTIIHQGIDEDITPELLPKYQKDLTFSENYTLNCVKYFYTNLLKHYQNELLDIYKELNNLDNYQNMEYRNFLVDLYNEANKNYLFIRRIMEEELTKYNDDINKVKEDEDEKKVYYGVKSSGITFIESDLKNIPKDTYTSIKDLLILFRKGKLSPNKIKKLNGPLAEYQEIKDDQIRISFKHLKDNEYVILGVFIKQENELQKQDRTYYERKPESLVDAVTIEEDLFNNLTTHSGGRRNA